jgi:hypothetical protein
VVIVKGGRGVSMFNDVYIMLRSIFCRIVENDYFILGR